MSAFKISWQILKLVELQIWNWEIKIELLRINGFEWMNYDTIKYPVKSINKVKLNNVEMTELQKEDLLKYNADIWNISRSNKDILDRWKEHLAFKYNQENLQSNRSMKSINGVVF